LESNLNGVELRIRRIRLGMHQYELAARLGILPARLCEIEHGRRALSLELAKKIKSVLREKKNNSNP